MSQLIHRQDAPIRVIRNFGIPLPGVLLLAIAFLAACAGPATVDMSAGHLADEVEPVADIPPVAEPVAAPAAPKPMQPVETYSVVVKEVPITDLLFSLAREAGLELDLQSTENRTITINAVDRPLRDILERIANQANLRYRLDGRGLLIEDDAPYWKNYVVDYVNVSRSSDGTVGVATEISTTGGSVGEQQGQQEDEQGNTSKTVVTNKSENDFWLALKSGLLSVARDSNAGAAGSRPELGDPVIVNPMSGIVTVIATQRQHREVQRYLDTIMASSKRQVLIEMTIVEVELSDNYQAGVDWRRVSDNFGLGSNGLSVETNLLGPDLQIPPFVALGYNSFDDANGGVSATVRLLQQFGDTKVLSSPKIMALNNQTALLKVVNETVYFTVQLDIREATIDLPERRTFTSDLHTVPVGLVLSVTPQISEHGYVSLNIRPTISRITGYAIDPAPRLSGADFDNLIPEIQVREIESLLQVLDGRTVVLGGLMQNERVSEKDGVPGLSRIPKVGKLFSYSQDKMVKTELVIFLKPTVIENAIAPADGLRMSDYYESDGWAEAAESVDYR